MINLEIIDYTKEGLGIAKYNDETIFVKNALLGENVDVEIFNVKKNIKYANVIKFNTISKNRVKPKCKHFLKCGGCHLMHMNYEEQLLVKKKGVISLMKKNHIDVNDFDIVKSDDVLEYRNKITFTFFKDKELYLGFNKIKTHKGIDIDKCLLVSSSVNDLKDEVLNILKSLNLTVYDKQLKKGILKNIVIKKNSLNEHMLILNTNAKNISIFNCLKNINASSIIINGSNDKKIIKQKYLLEKCNGITYQISDEAFFQVNTKQMINMYNDVKSLVNNGDNILDAYCGIGSIGLFLSSSINSIVGIEINKSAVIDAKNNAILNGVKNAKYYCGDIKRLISNVYKKDDFDTLIIDPPRKGIDKNFISIINEIKPKNIVYISCNAATLIRDINLLSKSYDINFLKSYDMFSQTFHVESIVSLKLKK